MRIATVVLVVILALAAMSSAAFRATELRETPRPIGTREHPAHVQGAPTHALELAVDGATNPDAIPDERAYAHFLAAMASANSVTRNATLAQAGLGGPDRVAFVAGLGSLKADLDAVTELRKTGASSDRVLQRQRAATEGARVRVQQMLSADGAQRLETYIRTKVKRGIKIYRAPMVHAPEAAQ